MIRRVANGLRLFLLVQWRSYFPHLYLGIALVTVAAFRLALPESVSELLLPVILFAEPGLLGLMMVAAQSFLERGEGSASALALTPLSSGEHVLALVGSTALIGTAAGLVMQAGIGGLDLRLIRLVPPLLATCALAGCIGLAVSARFSEFTRFLVGGYIPVLFVFELPLLTWFGVLPRWALVWHPGDSSLYAIADAVAPGPLSAGRLLVECAVLFGFAAVALVLTRRIFEERVRAHLEVA